MHAGEEDASSCDSTGTFVMHECNEENQHLFFEKLGKGDDAIDEIQKLLQICPEFCDQPDTNGQRPLHFVAGAGKQNLEVLHLLLKFGAS